MAYSHHLPQTVSVLESRKPAMWKLGDECFWSFSGALCPKSIPGPWSVDSSLPIFPFPGPVPDSSTARTCWRFTCKLVAVRDAPTARGLETGRVCRHWGPVAWPGGAQTILVAAAVPATEKPRAVFPQPLLLPFLHLLRLWMWRPVPPRRAVFAGAIELNFHRDVWMQTCPFYFPQLLIQREE